MPVTDPRLAAAELTEQEFVGHLVVRPNPGGDFLDAYRDLYPTWSKLQSHALLHPKDGYTLYYDSTPKTTPLAFLGYKGVLVGVFESDNLTVNDEHQREGLGSELILAGFAQVQWKNMTNRKVTEAGAATLHKAYQLARETARQHDKR
jgi:hypothetical protein